MPPRGPEVAIAKFLRDALAGNEVGVTNLEAMARGRGCRHRSRNDKNCRDACVPLEHDTTLPRRPQVNARNGVRVSLAKGPRLTGGLHDVRQIR
jgi:hypothetical protein